MIKNGNFCGQLTPSVIDTEYQNCNFVQEAPVDSGGGVFVGTRIFPGDNTPRTFFECNMINAEPPPGSTLTRCNTAVIERGLDGRTEIVTVDGEDVVIQHHNSRYHGRYTESGYEYLPVPRDTEVD